MIDTRTGSSDHPSRIATTARDWSTIVLCGLIGARYFVPAESADQGETLWLVVLTLIFSGVQSVIRWRTGSPGRGLDRIDVAVGVMVAAHVASAGLVLSGSGQKRAAFNMAWEWGTTLVVWHEVRACFQRGHGATLLRSVLVAAVLLGAYGIWQNQVWFQANATLVAEMEQLESRTDRTDVESERLRKIQEGFGPAVLSAQGGARVALLNRIRSSTEPIGCFALANTLAGVLLAGSWLVRGNGLWFRHDPTRGEADWHPGLVQIWLPRLGVAGCYLSLGLCLLMTKSRTAWVGMLAATGLVWFASRTGRRMRTAAIVAVAVVAAGATLLMVAFLAGLIDSQVISEAPKSLKYRLEYWVSTSKVILDQPWMGVGPGNFRASYLQHKLPGASEEILDPHNLLLDVWANAGILAGGALVSLIFWGGRGGWRLAVAESKKPSTESLPLIRWSESVLAAAAGPALVSLQMMAFGMEWDLRVMALAITAAFLGGWLANLAQRSSLGSVWGAWLGLTIHLCGAGGIAMPVISQLWLLLLAGVVTRPANSCSLPEATARMRLVQPVVAGCLLVLAVICLRTSLLPNAICQAQLSLADEAIFLHGDRRGAERHLIAAAEADPWQPLPWIQLLQLRTAEAVAGGTDREVESAAESGREALARHPQNPLTYEFQGDLYYRSRDGHPERVAIAVKWYREAVDRYPQSSRLLAKLAVALESEGQHSSSRSAALAALKLDDLNRQAGHIDKLLEPAIRTALEVLVVPLER
ncbi:MAG: hypothetical protein DWH91_06050 [Planctomycetota bacterium]|nr:MAG: hypothetical protein DWH91_06050 [Planctomycetota bacterium]